MSVLDKRNVILLILNILDKIIDYVIRFLGGEDAQE